VPPFPRFCPTPKQISGYAPVVKLREMLTTFSASMVKMMSDVVVCGGGRPSSRPKTERNEWRHRLKADERWTCRTLNVMLLRYEQH